MMKQTIKPAMASFVVAAAVTALVVSLVYAAEGEGPKPGHSAMPTPPSVANAAQRFSERTSSPSSTVARNEPVIRATADYKQDPATLVVSEVERAGARVKLAVGDKAVCFEVSVPTGAGSLGCAPAVSATDPDRPIIAVDTYEKGFRVSGAMIDGVTDTVIHLADGSAVPATLAADVFSVEVVDIPIKLTYRKPDGSMGATKLDH
jgi:hypothetical protein